MVFFRKMAEKLPTILSSCVWLFAEGTFSANKSKKFRFCNQLSWKSWWERQVSVRSWFMDFFPAVPSSIGFSLEVNPKLSFRRERENEKKTFGHSGFFLDFGISWWFTLTWIFALDGAAVEANWSTKCFLTKSSSVWLLACFFFLLLRLLKRFT